MDMSYIRPGTSPKWVDEASTNGLYVYSDKQGIIGMPTSHPEFVEVVMRMLEQSDHLSDDELENVFQAFAYRFHWDEQDKDLTRNRTRSDAYWDMLTALAWMEDRDGWESEYEQAKEIWNKIDPKAGIEKE